LQGSLNGCPAFYIFWESTENSNDVINIRSENSCDIEDEDLQDRWGKPKERERLLKAAIDTIQSKLSSVPTEEEITRTAQIMQRDKESFFQGEAHLKEMSFEDKQALLQNLFGGTDKDGKRYGVYVEKMKKKG
jgi:hypothetical protein